MSEHQQIQQSKKPDSTFQKQATPVNLNTVSHPASIIQRVRINPKSLTAADVLQLQRTIGNRAVGRLLSEIRNPSKVQQMPIQRQEIPEEETLQGKMIGTVQRQEISEEEKEPLQGKFETIQRLEPEEEEKLQMKSVVQRQEIPEEEEPIQGKMIGTIQRQEIPEEEPLQKKSENNTGMPDNLKAGVESLSGIDMSDARVHYNSSKPAEVGALAYTQGKNIHVAPGQERHLPHEAWHVVQQAQGRVRPTLQVKDRFSVNDDRGLEYEADVMGAKILQMQFKESNDSFTKKMKNKLDLNNEIGRDFIIQGVFLHYKCNTKNHFFSDEQEDEQEVEEAAARDDYEYRGTQCKHCRDGKLYPFTGDPQQYYYCSIKSCNEFMVATHRRPDDDSNCLACGGKMLNLASSPATLEPEETPDLETREERQLKALIKQTSTWISSHHHNTGGQRSSSTTEKHSQADHADAKQRQTFITKISEIIELLQSTYSDGMKHRVKKLISQARGEISRLESTK